MATKKADEYIMSEADLAKIDNYSAMYQQYMDAGDTASADAAHNSAEALRAQYGYSGGNTGAEYIGVDTPSAATYDAPDYVSRYQDQIDALSNQIMNRDPFSYDYTTDPTYQQYAEAYTRNGENAMEDTLGQVSARTGGLASSYATTAANQTYNGYMEALSDKIPELEQAAYAMYQDEGNQMLSQLSMLTGLDDGQYNKYLTDLNQYNTNRAFDYGVSQDESAKYKSMADNMIATGQMPSTTILELAKIDPEYAQSMVEYYQMKQAVKSSGGGGSSKTVSSKNQAVDYSYLGEQTVPLKGNDIQVHYVGNLAKAKMGHNGNDVSDTYQYLHNIGYSDKSIDTVFTYLGY